MLDAQYDVTAIGRPYVDLIANVGDGLLKNFGLIKGQTREIQPAQMLAIRSELTNFTVWPGGSPPNTCAVIHALGGKAVFLGKVCDDQAGRAFRASFPLGSVLFPNANHISPGRPISGSCYVLITPDEAATVVHTPGVGDLLTEADIFPGLIADSKLLYFQAHFLFAETSKTAVIKAMGVAKAAKREIAVSLHDHRMNTQQIEFFVNRYLPDIDILNGNRIEFTPLLDPIDFADAKKANKLMIMTDGAKGAYIRGRGEELFIEPHLLKARDNTVGAGDAFAAGFFYSYVNGLPLQTCGEMAAETASAILDITGARPTGNWKYIADKYLANAPWALRRVPSPGQSEGPEL